MTSKSFLLAKQKICSSLPHYFSSYTHCINRYCFIHFVPLADGFYISVYYIINFADLKLGFRSHVLVLVKINFYHKTLLKCIVEMIFIKECFKTRKLTQEELEKKRQEMMENAKYDIYLR